MDLDTNDERRYELFKSNRLIDTVAIVNKVDAIDVEIRFNETCYQFKSLR